MSSLNVPGQPNVTLPEVVSPCNATERTFALDFHVSRADIDLILPSQGREIEWELRYVDQSNNTMMRLAAKWGYQDYDAPPVGDDDFEPFLEKINNTTEVICIPSSECVTFAVLGLTGRQFTVRVDDAILPLSIYEERTVYLPDTSRPHSVFTAELPDDQATCIPQCDDANEDLLELTIWGNSAGSSLQWWLAERNQNTKPVARCPRHEYGGKQAHKCAYRDYYLYFARLCIDTRETYRLAFYNEFFNVVRDEPGISLK